MRIKRAILIVLLILIATTASLSSTVMACTDNDCVCATC